MDKDLLRKIMQASGATPEQIEKAIAEAQRQEELLIPPVEPRLTMTQFDELITETVRKALEPLTKVDRKHMRFPTDPAGAETMTKQERMGKFMRAVIRRDTAEAVNLSMRTALTEGTDSTGGYLVPEEFQNDIYVMIEQENLIRRFGTVVPMKSDTLNVNSVTAKITAYWIGESNTITASNPTFGRPILYAKKLAGITSLSNELGEDSVVNLYDLLVRLFAEAFGAKEDYEGLRGTGAVYTGILNHADAAVTTMSSGNTAFSNIAFTDLASMIASLTTARRQGARFVFHRDVQGYLQKLVSSDGQYLWKGASAAEGPPPTIWGYPWNISEQMPAAADTAVSTKFVTFGDLRWVIFGDRKAITVKVLEEGTVGSDNLGEQDMSALRIIERIGIVVSLGDNFAVLRTAAS